MFKLILLTGLLISSFYVELKGYESKAKVLTNKLLQSSNQTRVVNIKSASNGLHYKTDVI